MHAKEIAVAHLLLLRIILCDGETLSSHDRVLGRGPGWWRRSGKTRDTFAKDLN